MIIISRLLPLLERKHFNSGTNEWGIIMMETIPNIISKEFDIRYLVLRTT